MRDTNVNGFPMMWVTKWICLLMIVELKEERIIRTKQHCSYLSRAVRGGPSIHFNAPHLHDGIRRKVL